MILKYEEITTMRYHIKPETEVIWELKLILKSFFKYCLETYIKCKTTTIVVCIDYKKSGTKIIGQHKNTLWLWC